MATVLHQGQKAAFVFSLLACDVCQSAAAGGSAARGGDATGQSFVGPDSSNLPTGEGRGCGSMARCREIPFLVSLLPKSKG